MGAVAVQAPAVEPKVLVGIICWSMMGSDDVGQKCYVTVADAYRMACELTERRRFGG